MSLADTHCHLYFEAFKADLSSVLDRAWAAGLSHILLPGIDLETSRQALDLAEKHINITVAVGVHPNDALTWTGGTLKELQELARHPSVVAIGEIGLDFYRDRAPHDVQEKILRSQLDLAEELQLPVVIHTRQSEEALWAILTDWHNRLVRLGSPIALRPGVLHSFSGDGELANKAVQANFYLGIGGPVTYRNAPDRQKLVTGLPLENLLLETDAPFLTPHPYRGRRNEPSYVAYIAEKIAELHQTSPQAVAEQTSRNADRLFHWSAIS